MPNLGVLWSFGDEFFGVYALVYNILSSAVGASTCFVAQYLHANRYISFRSFGSMGRKRDARHSPSALGGYSQDSKTGKLLAAEVRVIRVEVEVESDLKALPEPEGNNEPVKTTELAVESEQTDNRPGPAVTTQQVSEPAEIEDVKETAAAPTAAGELEIAASPSGPPAVNVIEEGLRILRDTVEIARQFAQRYISLVRIRLDQFWLGPSESQLRVTWISKLLDSDGRDMRVGYSDPMPVRLLWSESALSTELHATLVRQASEGVEPSLAETFLRDGEYAAYRLTDPKFAPSGTVGRGRL